MDWYKIVAGVASLWAVISTAAILPLRKQLNRMGEKVDNMYSKKEVVEQIEFRQQLLMDELHRLNQNIGHLSECTSKLTDKIMSINEWQAREEGRRNN